MPRDWTMPMDCVDYAEKKIGLYDGLLLMIQDELPDDGLSDQEIKVVLDNGPLVNPTSWDWDGLQRLYMNGIRRC